MRVDQALAQALAAGVQRADAEILLAHASGRARTRLWAFPEFQLDAAVLERYGGWIERRCRGEPVAYLLGSQEFYGLPLGVDARVLVPRPETELLVEFALARFAAEPSIRVLDLGTGSGAIALAIASQRPGWSVTAVDRSAEALLRARDNALRLGLAQVEWLCGDWLQPVAGRQFELVLSNPPYLAAGDPHLADLRFEPLAALVAGPNGYECIERIVDHSRAVLVPGGWLALEHGWDQATGVTSRLRAAGYQAVGSTPDLAGHLRISHGRQAGAEPA